MRTAEQAYEQTNGIINAAVNIHLEKLDKEINTKIEGGLFELKYTIPNTCSTDIAKALLDRLNELGYCISPAVEKDSWIICWSPHSK